MTKAEFQARLNAAYLRLWEAEITFDEAATKQAQDEIIQIKADYAEWKKSQGVS